MYVTPIAVARRRRARGRQTGVRVDLALACGYRSCVEPIPPRDREQELLDREQELLGERVGAPDQVDRVDRVDQVAGAGQPAAPPLDMRGVLITAVLVMMGFTAVAVLLGWLFQ